MARNLLVLRGIPASGKSTFAIHWVDEDPQNRVRINRDSLREQMFGKFWPVDENAVTVAQNAMLKALLPRRDVVLDNTNLNTKNLKDTLRIAENLGATVGFRDFEIDLDDAGARDLERIMRGERGVGADVVLDFYRRYTKDGKLPPVPEFKTNGFAPYTPPEGAIGDAIIVDIDGTLAHFGAHRGPYDKDESKYLLDEFDSTVAAIVESWKYLYPSTKVIVLSGREDRFRKVTEQWLAKHFFEYDRLYMRATGDQRNDAIVKNEIFDQYISPNYNVPFCLDDRNRVVEMWRAKGLKVFQVAEGDF